MACCYMGDDDSPSMLGSRWDSKEFESGHDCFFDLQ